MTNNLGEILKQHRKAKGLTLQLLSQRSKVSVSHVARIERGERFPSGHILHKLASPLDFSEVELLKLANFMSRDASDDRLDRLKKEIKAEIAHALMSLWKRIDDF